MITKYFQEELGIMENPNQAVAVWFNGKQDDNRYLDLWREAPITYHPDQPMDSDWHVDRYEVVLGKDPSGELFQRAGSLTMRNRFYPPQVMINTSDFQREDRPVRTGDRVVQRIRILMAWDRPLLEVLTLNQITEVIDEPRRKGFTYTTTAVHSETGEWSPCVEWRENNEVVLIITVVSNTRPGASRLSRRLIRWLQLRAHHLSIQNFKDLLRGGYSLQRSLKTDFVPSKVVPSGLLAIATLLFLGAVYNFSKK
jgi:uncharacterized protein (UPF0548 family)